jgi:regulator of RNase E activity RraA
MPNIGFRILPMPARPTGKLVKALAAMVTAHLSDNMNRLVAGGAALRPMHRGGKLCGPALTVKVAPGDNLMVHKAIDIAAPGDVIVVDAGGLVTCAIIGDIMSSLAEKRGVAGMVIYGAIRDAAEIGARRFPVYACGVTHRGPYKNGPGEINAPIALDGMVVHPGDIIVMPTAWSPCRWPTPGSAPLAQTQLAKKPRCSRPSPRQGRPPLGGRNTAAAQLDF